MDAPAWSFSNEVRIAATLMVAAIVVLLAGFLAFLVLGQDELALVDVLLGAGVFLILFTVLVVPFRLRGRGPTSYSLVVEGSMDAVEEVVRGALEEGGVTASIEVPPSRFRRPARTLAATGVASRFILKDAPYRQTSKELRWTEIIQTGFAGMGDADARTLRDRVSARVALLQAGRE